MKAVAQRYAAALVDVAVEQGAVDELKKQLSEFIVLLGASADLRNFLSNPAVGRTQKQAVIEKLVARMGASKALRNFLFVLVDNRRTGILPEIQEVFISQLHARLGVVDAEVVSAQELSGQEKTELIAALAKLTGKRVEARYATNTELIGGAVVRIGSTIYDGSVRQQLNSLRERLSSE